MGQFLKEPLDGGLKTSMFRRGNVGVAAGLVFLPVLAQGQGEFLHAGRERVRTIVGGRRFRRKGRRNEPLERGPGLQGRLEPQLLRQREHERDYALDFPGRKLLLCSSQEERHLFLQRQPAEVIGRGGAELTDLDKGKNVRGEPRDEREPFRDPALLAAQGLGNGRGRHPFPLVKIAHQECFFIERDRASAGVELDHHRLRRLEVPVLDDDGDLGDALRLQSRQTFETVDELVAVGSVPDGRARGRSAPDGRAAAGRNDGQRLLQLLETFGVRLALFEVAERRADGLQRDRGDLHRPFLRSSARRS